MSRLLFLLFAVALLLLVGLALVNEAILVLAVPLLVYVAIALARATPPATLSVRRQVDVTIIREGDEATITLTLVNEGAAIEQLFVEDLTARILPVAAGETQALASLATGETLGLTYTVRGVPGTLELPDVQVTTGEALGLFTQTMTLAARARLVMIPDFPRLRRMPVRPLRTIGFTGPILSRQSGAGADFYGVRQYQMGDPLRRINWRTTARHTHTLFSTEFEQEHIADVGLILDARPKLSPLVNGHSLLPQMVQATAALADVLLRDGHRVGLLMYGQGSWVFPGYGRGQRERILRALALREVGTKQLFHSLAHLPTQLFPARSQLLLVTPLEANDERVLLRLRANGYAVVIISPDPVTFEAGLLPQTPLLATAMRLARLERRLLLQRLRHAGLVVVDWPVTQSLDEVIATQLHTLPPARYMRMGTT